MEMEIQVYLANIQKLERNFMKITKIEKLQKLRNVDENKLFETSSQSRNWIKKQLHQYNNSEMQSKEGVVDQGCDNHLSIFVHRMQL